MARFGEINAQYFDDAGDPLGSGKLYFYESGTTTPKVTYADINLTIPNTNPVILTAAGRQPNIFFNGNAKGILTDKNDVQILVRDPIGETGTNFGDAWVATTIYSANAVVIGSDGVYYRSLSNGNQNNNPTTTSGFWTLLYSVQWNAGITYDIGAVVTYDNQQYQSLQTSNLNQNPETQTAYWVGLEFAWIATATYAEDQNVVGTDGILYTSLQAANIGNDPATSPAYWVGTSAAAAASAVAAAASATASASSATDSANSATASANSATASANSATASASSATDSANSATTSASSATDSANSATASAASASAAATSESNAATSESNAATSASNSATSASASAASASAASASESAAAASEAAAATSESNAAASASSSASSATDSANSATASASSATDSANSATASAGSATASAGSATAAAGSATAAAGSATAAAGSATAASDKYDEFDARYLGEKASDPSVDNQGGALVEGALYFNTTSDAMKVYDGSSWVNVAPVATSVTISQISDYTGTATELNYTVGVTSNIQTQFDNIDDLPSQTGNTGKFLTTNGTAAAWDSVDVSSEITGTLPVANGGTGAASLAANNVVLGNGTSPVQVIAPSTAGNVLTSDGTTWASAPAPSASPTFEATASGSIANGDAVIVNSDGTVSSIVETTGAASLGPEVSLTSANTLHSVSAYHADQKSVVAFYIDSDNSSYLTAVVGSALDGAISWGTPQVVFSAAIGNLYKAVYHATEKVIVLTYFRQSNTTVRLKAFSLAAGSLSGGNEASANGGSRPTLTYDSTTDLIICGYRQIGSPYYGEALTVSVSGTTLTTNTITVISSAFSEYTGLSYDPVQNKTLYVYGELSTGKSEARILTVSGTNISAGSAVQNWMGSGNYPEEAVALIYDSQTDQHIAFTKESSSGNDGVSVALAISGSSITFGSLYEFESNSTAYVRAAYVPAANKFIVGYTLTSGNDLYAIIASVSGTVISFTGKQLLRTSIQDNSELDVASFEFLKTAVITYDETSAGEFARTYSPVTFNSNLTSGNYIGISDAAYSDGATATVQIVGSVDDAQSGLSAGQAYYVQSNGTFGNSPDIVSVFGGTAVSATKLIVKG